MAQGGGGRAVASRRVSDRGLDRLTNGVRHACSRRMLSIHIYVYNVSLLRHKVLMHAAVKGVMHRSRAYAPFVHVCVA